MKKDDMMKLYKEEKPGLKIVPNKINLLLFALFLSKEILPQIPINGLCQFNDFAVEKGFNSIFSLNYNNDSYTDLLLYSPTQKKIVTLAGEKNGAFDTPKTYKVPYPITAIRSLNDGNSKIMHCAFVSRKYMRAGIYSISTSGRAYLNCAIKFNSYPENISTADIYKNGTDEFLVSGSSFDGLSIISHSGTLLKEKKIVSGTSFSNSLFANLSNHRYQDIAAFDIFKNSLIFFYNDGSGKFRPVRSIKTDQPIHSLHAVDLNLDNYIDLIYAEGKSINILYGDFASAYNIKTRINTIYYPDQIITGDFNRDGKIDLAYLNYEHGTVSIIYAKNYKDFYPEIIYLKKDSLRNIIPYYSKFINGIASISSKGSLDILKNLPSVSGNINISIGAEPAAISYFDDGNNGINDICFIDNYNLNLNLIVRNTSGIPSLFYSYPLFDNFTDIVVDNYAPRVKTFYCFSHDKKLIEILKIDFSQNKAENNYVYSPGEIEDLKIQRTGNDFDNIYLAYREKGKLGFCIMEYRNYKYSSTIYPGLASDVLTSNITLSDGPGLDYWQKIHGGAVLIKTAFLNGSVISNPLFTYWNSNISSIFSFTGDLFNNDKDAVISFINTEKNYYTVVSNFKKTMVINPDEFSYNSGVDSLKLSYLSGKQAGPESFRSRQVYFGDVRTNGLKKLYVYSPGDSSINRIDFINRGKNIAAPRIADAGNVLSYFIKNMSLRNYHLVYTSKSINCITIRQL